MKKHQLIPLLSLCASTILAQNKDSINLPEAEEVKKPLVIINPKGKFYIGGELGMNFISTERSSLITNTQSDSDFGIQAGFMAEYYFLRSLSLQAKLKFYEGQVVVQQAYSPSTNATWLSGGTPETPAYNGSINASIFTLPVALKYEFRIMGNFAANIKLGMALAKDLSTNYKGDSHFNRPQPNWYFTNFFGLGLNFFIDERSVFYLDYEGMAGPVRADIGKATRGMKNSHFSLGFKYSLN